MWFEEREVRDNSLNGKRWWAELSQGHLTFWLETLGAWWYHFLTWYVGHGAIMWGRKKW